jgi:hypothetical protein
METTEDRAMEVRTVLGFDDAELVFEAPVSAALLTAAYWVAGADAESLGGAGWPLSEADAEALLGELPAGPRWFLEAVAE